MRTHAIGTLLLAGCLLAGSTAAAQETATRAGEAASTRIGKAATATKPDHGRLERLLDFVERSPTVRQVLAPEEGFGVRIGGIDRGAALAVGPRWISPRAWNDHLQLHASGATWLSGDAEAEAGVVFTRHGLPNLQFTADVTARHLARERFFGTGPRSDRTAESAFALDERQIRLGMSVDPLAWLRVTAGGGITAMHAADGDSVRLPAISAAWKAHEVVGLTASPTYGVFSTSATVDLRDVPGNPRTGGRYHAALNRYDDRGSDRYSFNRLDVELEQHFSGWRKQRTLSLRTVGTLTQADAGHAVPFFLQPTLGGSSLLRGFPTDRFRDRHRVLLQTEYGWDVWPFLSAVVFYEAGMVADRISAFAFDAFRHDYGLGFRLGSARTVALRTDVALGSGEGTRISIKVRHAF